MRAAKTEPFLNRVTQRWNLATHIQPSAGKGKATKKTGWGAGLGILFLLGYTAGVWVCRQQVPALGQALAQYYMDKQNYLEFSAICVAQFAALFWQAGIIVLCGSSILGNAFLTAFFAGRGLILGMCASAVFLSYQARGLVVYWLLTFLPDAAVLILLLWLAQKAAELSITLLRSVLSGTATHGTFRQTIQALLFRYMMVLIVGAGCSALGASAAGLFARILL